MREEMGLVAMARITACCPACLRKMEKGRAKDPTRAREGKRK
jgi:hypothetical protein